MGWKKKKIERGEREREGSLNYTFRISLSLFSV
jgi:hypothetical protein